MNLKRRKESLRIKFKLPEITKKTIDLVKDARWHLFTSEATGNAGSIITVSLSWSMLSFAFKMKINFFSNILQHFIYDKHDIELFFYQNPQGK